ncbi:MAG TPA: hypothetical protein ENK02_10925 [Planctomycetes bacterium]|nr:hypothetical protein [Planctomycetota bacterium]
MEIIDYYNEKKWCDKCGTYVRFLMSVDYSFCVNCGSRVRLFNEKDLKAFHRGLQQEKEAGKGKRRKTKAS